MVAKEFRASEADVVEDVPDEPFCIDHVRFAPTLPDRFAFTMYAAAIETNTDLNEKVWRIAEGRYHGEPVWTDTDWLAESYEICERFGHPELPPQRTTSEYGLPAELGNDMHASGAERKSAAQCYEELLEPLRMRRALGLHAIDSG
ncbi:MAG: hypothetical protein AAFP90_24530, partial [Planctomycetota bacterium]